MITITGHVLTYVTCWIFHVRHVFDLAHTRVHCDAWLYDCGRVLHPVATRRGVICR